MTSLDVTLKEDVNSEPIRSVSAKGEIDMDEDIPTHVKQINLDGRTESQKRSTLKLLCEEQNPFSRNDDDIGIVPDLKLNINMTDNIPVQKNYDAVPRPLYPEVKAYIEDLLNKNFICKSTSPYTSPVACVRKKDQSLRLCVDFCALNQRQFQTVNLFHVFKKLSTI